MSEINDIDLQQAIYSLNQEIFKAHKAEEITENALYKEAWKGIDEVLYQRFKECKSLDVEQLQEIRLMIGAAQTVRNYFEALINNGKLAQHDINELAMSEKAETENQTIN